MKKIFESAALKNMPLKNRLIRSATWEGIANPDGSVKQHTKYTKNWQKAESVPSLQALPASRCMTTTLAA